MPSLYDVWHWPQCQYQYDIFGADGCAITFNAYHNDKREYDVQARLSSVWLRAQTLPPSAEGLVLRPNNVWDVSVTR